MINYKKLSNKQLRLVLEVLWRIEDILDRIPWCRKIYISFAAEDEMQLRNDICRFKKLKAMGRLRLLGLLSKKGYLQYIDIETREVWLADEKEIECMYRGK